MRTSASRPQIPDVTTDVLAVMTAPHTAAPAMNLGEVYAREFDWVWHTLRRLGVASRNLPDVAHDVFLVVHRRAHTFDPSRPLRPWLFCIAYRVARDHHALGRNRNEALDPTHEPVDPSPPQDHHVAASEARALVLAALQSLDLERRAVFILHDLDEQPMHEIAASLDVPAKTLYARLKVAREQFAVAVRRLQLARGQRP